MPATDLRAITDFESLRDFLEDELDWNLSGYSFDDLTFTYAAEELGLKPEEAAGVKAIHQLRPLSGRQPWGIFFVEFESKRLPVVVMRRILSSLVLRKRASANQSERAAFAPDDLLFITRFGTASEPEIAFAHFHQENARTLPVLRVLGWDGNDAPLKLERVAGILRERLCWPADDSDHAAWREQWAGAFRHRIGHVIRTSDLLATELAALARRVRDAATAIMERETQKGPLTRLYLAFKEALLHDLTPETFADTYAQTISYGLFTAAISRTVPGEGKQGTYLSAIHVADLVPVTSPFLKEMLSTFLEVGGKKGGLDFDELGVQSIVDLFTGEETDMDAILRDFGNKTRGEDPVIHFYEHFLNAYNKQLKIQRGVFYTPNPVVSYIVRSVHELLQAEFGLEHGLADTTTWGEMLKKHPELKLPTTFDDKNKEQPISEDEFFVQIIDPATGTATFPVEVIEVVHNHLKALWEKRGPAAMPRIPNSKSNIQNWSEYWNEYVPKALLPRIHAFELMMAPYAIAHMKVGLKLAETGYRFGSNERARIYLTNALEPWVTQLPLIGFDALANEAAAVNEIKRHKRFTVVIGNPPYSNFGQLNKNPFILGLLEDYKRGLDEKKINLDDDFIKFVRFSQNLLATTGIGVCGMITSNTYLDGVTHWRMRECLLETFNDIRVLDLHGSLRKRESAPGGGKDENVFDIQQGVAVGHFIKLGQSCSVSHADVWGERESKYEILGKNHDANLIFQRVKAAAPNFYFLAVNAHLEEEYTASPSIKDILVARSEGIMTSRDEFIICFEMEELLDRLQQFRDLAKSDHDISAKFGIADTRDWSLTRARKQLAADKDWKAGITKMLTAPFDQRLVHHSKTMLDWPRMELMRNIANKSNVTLLTTRQTKDDFGVLATNLISRHKSASRYDKTFVFPLYSYPESREQRDLLASSERVPNFAPRFLRTLADTLQLQQKGEHGLPAGLTPEDIFHYAYAVFHSPGYRTRYAEFLKIDFPRLPLTSSIDLFLALARLGGELVSLHLLESPALENPRTKFVGSSREVVKVGWVDDTVWIDAGGKKTETRPGTSGFPGVPEAVWNFHIGGYQVCEKWLKDRKGRTLSDDDIAHYHKIVIALGETIRLMAEIDEVINRHGGWPGAFSQKG